MLILVKEPHSQVSVDSVVVSGSLGGVMAKTQALNSTDVGSFSALGEICPIFIIPTTYTNMCAFIYFHR